MQALVLKDAGRMELADIPQPSPLPHEVVVRVGAVGLCGTDFHIYEGSANYNLDAAGRPVPLAEEPQILGHEFCGTIAELGSAVEGLGVGDRVVVDQGLNCSSRRRAAAEWCEYCATGNTHQCADYEECGISGRQGALAEFVAVPAPNAIRIEGDLPFERAALSEPLGCIAHATEMALATPARYTFGGERPVRSVLICGAGPAGLLFTQYLRNVVGYAGQLIVSEPGAERRALAESYGASATVDPMADDLIAAVAELTRGERVHVLIDAAGVGAIFRQIPGLLRKQGTLMLYGHGHHGADMSLLNNVQYTEPTIISPCGASGAIDPDGRPRTYRRSLEMVSGGLIDVTRFVTHHYRGLAAVPQAFARDRLAPDYIKGVAVLN
jgi:threonine dehydrogenase-like Zn-dependent dehydrogenase